MKLPIYETLTGSLIMFRLNPKHRRANETDDDFYTRMAPQEFAKARTVMPELEGAILHGIDEGDIPTGHQDRKKWRIKRRAGKDVVEADQNIRVI